jgi:hypothetical protein
MGFPTSSCSPDARRIPNGETVGCDDSGIAQFNRFRPQRPFDHQPGVGAASGVSGNSALRRKNDAEQHPFVRACLPGSADMSATVRRDHVVDFVVGNRRPFAVHLDFVMVADHAALRWATVHEVTAGAFAVVSVELQIKVFMPPIMANPVISFLRRRADTKERRDDADYRYASSN